MASAAALFMHHAMTAGQALTTHTAAPMGSSPSSEATGASGASGSSGSSGSGDSSTISANDFLSLLVTEMQNQDPTADSDPNAYVNQLVQVNSLEQLIDINQTLSTAVTPDASSTTSDGATSTSNPASQTQLGLSPAALHGPVHALPRNGTFNSMAPMTSVSASTSAAAHSASITPSGAQNSIRHAPGNLGVPAASAASRRVAHALDGRSHAQSTAVEPASSQ